MRLYSGLARRATTTWNRQQQPYQLVSSSCAAARSMLSCLSIIWLPQGFVCISKRDRVGEREIGRERKGEETQSGPRLEKGS